MKESWAIKIALLARTCLFVLLAAFAAGAARAADAIATDTFKLALAGDWQRNRSSDPKRFSLRSEGLDTGLTVSTLRFKGGDLEQVARRLQDARLDAESDAAERFRLRMEIAEPRISRSGHGWTVQYFGRDHTGRHFRYFGIVMPGKLINIYVESPSAGLDRLETTLQSVFSGLEF